MKCLAAAQMGQQHLYLHHKDVKISGPGVNLILLEMASKLPADLCGLFSELSLISKLNPVRFAVQEALQAERVAGSQELAVMCAAMPCCFPGPLLAGAVVPSNPHTVEQIAQAAHVASEVTLAQPRAASARGEGWDLGLHMRQAYHRHGIAKCGSANRQDVNFDHEC